MLIRRGSREATPPLDEMEAVASRSRSEAGANLS